MRNVPLFNWIKISTFIITKTCLPFTLCSLRLCLPVFGFSFSTLFVPTPATLHPICSFFHATPACGNKPRVFRLPLPSNPFSNPPVASIDFSSPNSKPRTREIKPQVFLRESKFSFSFFLFFRFFCWKKSRNWRNSNPFIGGQRVVKRKCVWSKVNVANDVIFLSNLPIKRASLME